MKIAFYHLTRLSNIEEIKANGIHPSKDGYVYLCDNELDPFFMAPCGRAARTKFALSFIDKMPFVEKLALIQVWFTCEDARNLRKLPFIWFEGIRLIENNNRRSIYQQYLHKGVIPWSENCSYEVYTFCDPVQLHAYLTRPDENIGQEMSNVERKDIDDLLNRISRVLPC